jgi:hypothetical protein
MRKKYCPAMAGELAMRVGMETATQTLNPAENSESEATTSTLDGIKFFDVTDCVRSGYRVEAAAHADNLVANGTNSVALEDVVTRKLADIRNDLASSLAIERPADH